MFIWGENAQFLQYISTFVGTGDGDVCSTPTDTRADFYVFYEAAHQLLNCFYPQRRITITSRDPYYITPTIKAKLRRKNRLRRAGRTEEANALALQIGKDIKDTPESHQPEDVQQRHVGSGQVADRTASDCRRRWWYHGRVAQSAARAHLYRCLLPAATT